MFTWPRKLFPHHKRFFISMPEDPIRPRRDAIVLKETATHYLVRTTVWLLWSYREWDLWIRKDSPRILAAQ
jgi:hypothetical protein